MDANKRLTLAVALSLLVLLVYQIAFGPEPPQAEAPEEAARVEGEAQPERQGVEAAPRPRADEPERTVRIETEAVHLLFSSRGAGIRGAELQGPKGRRQGEDAEQVNLAEGLQPSDPPLFALVTGGGLPELDGLHPCSLAGASENEVRFRCAEGALQVEKVFRVDGARTLRLEATLRNVGTQSLEGWVELLVPARIDPAQTGGGGCGFSGRVDYPTRMVCRHGDDLTTQAFDPSEPVRRLGGPAAFGGIEERFFLAVATPLMPRIATSCELASGEGRIETRLRSQVGRIAAGDAVRMQWELVLGQKEMGFLQAVSERVAGEAQIANPRLDETVDLGFWAAIARILLWLLRLFHGLVPNWGVAIILLTVLVKVLTLPLSWKSMKSMEEVRKLAPEIEALKKKYGEDREKLNLEMMALYQRHKVNPLGGCLPMLIQMPIWIALYTTLLSSVELYNEPFIRGWISDLTSKDPFYLLPLAMGLTMFLTQKMQPMQVDATQQKILLYFMPVFFTLIMLNLPAGLTLYIFTNNVLSIGQQLGLRRLMGTEPPAKVVEERGKKRKS